MKSCLPFSNPLPETKIAIDAANAASKSIMEIYNQEFSASFKEDKQPITEADIKSNQIIEKIISVSEYPILSEESKDLTEKRLSSKKIWIVDPLDGTNDFVNKTGEFTVMIALVEDHYPVLGLIACPQLQTFYIAQKDQGAYSFSEKEKWQKITTNKISKISDFRVVGSRFHTSERENSFLKTLGISRYTPRGSSLKVVDICQGKAEFYFTMTNKMKQWDTCASYCLINEAGGKMTDVYGKEIVYNTKNLNHENGLLVTNGIIHSQIINEFKNF